MTASFPVPANPRAALLNDGWFRDCPASFQDALIAYARCHRLSAGEHLFVGGMKDGDLYCVLSGSLCVQASDIEGETPVLAMLEPCQWFGELSLVDHLPRSHDAIADTDAVVLCVPRTRIEDWLARHPAHWRDIARLAVGKLRMAHQVVGQEVGRPLAARVARRLCNLAHGCGFDTHQPRHHLRLTQEQLARMLGTTRSGVNKVLREFEQQGLVRLHYGEIELLQPSTLRERATVVELVDWNKDSRPALRMPPPRREP